MNVTFDVFLYKYREDPFFGLKNDNEGKPSIKDLEDVRLNTTDFDAAVNTDPTTIQGQVPALKEGSGAPDPLRGALEQNLLIQKKQADVDELNWLNTYKKDFWAKFKARVTADKNILANTINDFIAKPEAFINKTRLTDPTDSSRNCVVSLDDFRTNLDGIDNGAVLTLDYQKLKNLNIYVVENDVIEIIINYENGSVPVFYGFVTSVRSLEKYGDIVEYKITCGGLGKYLYLSRVIRDSALVTQFEQGSELDKLEITPFENLFNNLNVLDIFNTVMQRVLHLDSDYSSYSKQQSDYTQASQEIDLLNRGINIFSGFSSDYSQDVNVPAHINANKDLIESARNKGLIPLADFFTDYYPKTGNISTYIDILKARLDLSQVHKTEFEESHKLGTMPYALKYYFNFKPASENAFASFQFSLFLLLLYYQARNLSDYKDQQIPMAGTVNKPGTIKDTFALFYTANNEQYNAFNVMIRNAWERFYSQTTTPSWLMDTIRSITFYEVFEDRPGIITSRPPRYNLWLGTDYLVTKDKVLEFDKNRNDSQLLTRTDYKFMFPYFGTQEFIGGHWLDRDILYKYGLRADGPKDNPNVTSPTLGHFWSALDMIRANANTRRVTLTVPADKEYKLGSLYYFENKGVTPQEIEDAKNRKLVSIGIVGYITSITTAVSYGSVNTYTLELTYIRKAEYDGTNLNFYRIPDLETFMQYMEKLKAEGYDLNADTAAFQEKVNAEEVSKLQSWGDQEAIEWNGYYYAVDPVWIPKLKNILKNINKNNKDSTKSYQDFDETLRKGHYLRYANITSFTVDYFRSKGYSHIYPFVSQELINRLWAVDICMKHAPIDDSMEIPTLHKGPADDDKTFQVLLNPVGGTKVNSKYYSYADKRTDKEEAKKKEQSYIPRVLGQTCHNSEYLEYLFLDRSPSDLGDFLDTYLFDRTYNVQNGGTFRVGSKVEPPSDKPVYNSKYSRWYAASDFTYFNQYQIEVGLETIPDQYKLQFLTLANAGAFVGYKYTPEVTEPTRNAHRYGLEVDILPELLQYWKFSDLNAFLKIGIILPKDIGITNAILLSTDTIFKGLSSYELDTNYIYTPLLSLDKFKNFIKKFDFNYSKSSATKDKTGINATYPTLLPKPDVNNKPTYQYNITTGDTYHITVNHKLFKSDKALLPILNKRLRFEIDYNGNKQPDFPDTPDIYNKYKGFWDLALLIKEQVGELWQILAPGIALQTGLLSRIPISWGMLASGFLGGLGLSTKYPAGTRPEETVVETPYEKVKFWWDKE